MEDKGNRKIINTKSHKITSDMSHNTGDRSIYNVVRFNIQNVRRECDQQRILNKKRSRQVQKTRSKSGQKNNRSVKNRTKEHNIMCLDRKSTQSTTKKTILDSNRIKNCLVSNVEFQRLMKIDQMNLVTYSFMQWDLPLRFSNVHHLLLSFSFNTNVSSLNLTIID